MLFNHDLQIICGLLSAMPHFSHCGFWVVTTNSISKKFHSKTIAIGIVQNTKSNYFDFEIIINFTEYMSHEFIYDAQTLD